AITSTITTNDDGVAAAATPAALATAGDIAKAINQSGFKLAAEGTEGSELIRAGETATFNAGDNLTVSREGGTITYKTKKYVTFNNVQLGDNGPKISSNEAGNITVANNQGNPVKIAGLAEGTDANDAVNVSQLTKAQNAATTKVEAGSNIVVKTHKNADGSTKYTVSTADDLNVDSVKTSDTIMNNDGIKVGDKVALTNTGLKVGDVSVSSTGINAGGNKVTGVAKGDITQNSTDAVNGSQLYAVQQAANAAKTEIKAGENITVNTSTGQNNQTIYTVSAKDTSASVTAGSDAVTVTKSASARVGTADVTDYKVDLSQATKNDIAKGVKAKNIVDNKGLTFSGDSGTTGIKKLGDIVAIKGDDNITTKADANGLQVTLNKVVAVDTVTTGNTVISNSGIVIQSPTQDNPDNTVTLTQSGLNNGGQRITNVAPGVDATDAVNVNQLRDFAGSVNNSFNNLNHRINDVADDANAGVSSAMAMAALPQAYIPGKSMLTGGIASYNGEGAVAVGLSKLSDNGRWVLKVSGTADTQGNAGGAVGAGFHF
uniref:YadA family autotransporter adhesin n=1 Tax=Moraxella canis TaxID=90239 RepID=UPI0006654C6D